MIYLSANYNYKTVIQNPFGINPDNNSKYSKKNVFLGLLQFCLKLLEKRNCQILWKNYLGSSKAFGISIYLKTVIPSKSRILF